jgi:hypothetical protein
MRELPENLWVRRNSEWGLRSAHNTLRPIAPAVICMKKNRAPEGALRIAA